MQTSTPTSLPTGQRDNMMAGSSAGQPGLWGSSTVFPAADIRERRPQARMPMAQTQQRWSRSGQTTSTPIPLGMDRSCWAELPAHMADYTEPDGGMSRDGDMFDSKGNCPWDRNGKLIEPPTAASSTDSAPTTPAATSSQWGLLVRDFDSLSKENKRQTGISTPALGRGSNASTARSRPGSEHSYCSSSRPTLDLPSDISHRPDTDSDSSEKVTEGQHKHKESKWKLPAGHRYIDT